MTETTLSRAADAREELQRMEANMNQSAIDSVMQGKGNDSSPDSSNVSNTDGPDGTPSDSKGAEKLLGRDQLLAFLEENADNLPQGAETFKAMQRSMASQGNEARELRERLDKLEKEQEAPQEPSPEEVRRKQLLQRMPKQQRDLMEAYIEEMGLVSRDELENERQVERSTEHTSQLITEGIEKWGEDFGHMENDKFVWNPEIFDGVRSLYQTLKDPNEGITPNQLYVLHNFDKLMDDAFKRGQGESTGTDRINRLQRANGMARNSSSVPRSEPDLRQDGDSLEDVTAKAVKKAWGRLFK